MATLSPPAGAIFRGPLNEYKGEDYIAKAAVVIDMRNLGNGSKRSAVLAPHPPLSAYYDDAGERPGFVRRLFDDTAADYDRINALFSLGTGRRFRLRTLRRAGLRPGARVLDVATGTGLVADAARRIVGPAGCVAGLDVSWGMLQIARGVPDLVLIEGAAELLPFRCDQFDMVTMGYALRHVSSLDTAFAEFRRVLRPRGGALVLMEIGRPDSRLGRALAELYLGRLVPPLSGLLGSGRCAASLMRYYWDTIAQCVPPAIIVEALYRAGFGHAACVTEFGLFRTYIGRLT